MFLSRSECCSSSSRYLLGEGHEEVRDSVHVLARPVGLADEALDASGIGLGLVRDPVGDAVQDPALRSRAEDGVDDPRVHDLILGLGNDVLVIVPVTGDGLQAVVVDLEGARC